MPKYKLTSITCLYGVLYCRGMPEHLQYVSETQLERRNTIPPQTMTSSSVQLMTVENAVSPVALPSVRLCPVLCCHVCLFCCCSFFYCIFHFHGPQTIWWPFMAAADSGQKSTPIKTWITGQENMHVWMICCGQECAWYSILCIDCIFIVNMCKGMCKCVGGRCPLLNVQTDSRKLIRPIWWREQIRAAWYIRFCYLKIPLVSFYLKLLGFSLWWNKIQHNFWWWLTRLLSYICGHRVDKSSETITMGRIGVVSMHYM